MAAGPCCVGHDGRDRRTPIFLRQYAGGLQARVSLDVRGCAGHGGLRVDGSYGRVCSHQRPRDLEVRRTGRMYLRWRLGRAWSLSRLLRDGVLGSHSHVRRWVDLCMVRYLVNVARALSAKLCAHHRVWSRATRAQTARTSTAEARLHACMHAMHACMTCMQIPPGCACWHSVFSLAATALLLGANTDVFAMSLVAQ